MGSYLLVGVGIALAAHSLGRLVLCPWSARLALPERILFRFGLGTGLLSFIVFLLGVTGFLHAAPLWGLVIILAGTEIILLLRLRNELFRTLAISGPFVAPVLATGLVALILISAQGAPPLSFDGLCYHLALPKIYLREARLVFAPFNNASEWPALMHMLYVLTEAGESPAASQFLHGLFGFSCAALTFRLARVSLSAPAAFLAMALFVGNDLFVKLSVTPLIDLTVAFYALASLAAYQNWTADRCPRWLVLAGLFCGLMASTKLTGLPWTLLLGLSVGWHAFRRRCGWREALKHLFLLTGTATLVVSPWLLRSALNTGNPVWPFFYGIFGGRYWDNTQTQLYLKYSFEMNATGHWLADAGKKLISLFYSPGAEFHTGHFWALFLGIALWKRKEAWWGAPVFFSMGLSFLCLYLFLMPGSARYLLPILPLATIVIAGNAEDLLSRRQQVSPWALSSIGAGILVFSLFSQPRLFQKARIPWGLASAQAELDRLPVYRASQLINTVLRPADSVVLLNEYRGYYMDVPYAWGHCINQKFFNYDGVENVPDLVRRWTEKGMTHLWVNREPLFWPAEGGTAVARFLASPPIAQSEEGLLFSLRRSTEPSSRRLDTPEHF